jgi:hypothetical protein
MKRSLTGLDTGLSDWQFAVSTFQGVTQCVPIPNRAETSFQRVLASSAPARVLPRRREREDSNMSVAAARDYLQRALAELDEPPTPNVMRVRAGQDIALALKIAAPHTRVLVEVGKDIIYDGFDLGGLDYQGITVEPDTSALDGVGTVTAEMSEALIKLRATARPYDCALAATGPASRLNFRGVQFLPNPKSPSTAMVILGLDTATDPLQQPDGLTFDQCLGLGDPVTGCKRMFMANTRTITITRSACDHIFADTDAQAVATVCGPGPFIIRNNVWCSAGENFIAGGGNSNTPAMVAQYVEFLRNVCTARPEWRDKVRFPHLVRKNAFELKACAKALVKGNVFENVWQGAGRSASRSSSRPARRTATRRGRASPMSR